MVRTQREACHKLQGLWYRVRSGRVLLKDKPCSQVIEVNGAARMSVREASAVQTGHVAAGDRMSALLTHQGALVHADHSHRVASTGFKVETGADGAKYNVFEKDDVVWWYDQQGNAHKAKVVRVLDLSPEAAGLPEGYQVQLEGDTARIVDTVARKLRIFDPNEADEADEAEMPEHVDNSHAIIVRNVANMIKRARAAQAKAPHAAHAKKGEHPYRIIVRPCRKRGHVVYLVKSH